MPSKEPNRNRDGYGTALAYLITWACYGAWLPGEEGVVPRLQNHYGSRIPEPNPGIALRARRRMADDPYCLDCERAQIVLRSLVDLCNARQWKLWAAHVRTNHAHVVVSANCKPEVLLSAMKAFASRALNRHTSEPPDRRRWARHGSTRYLWADESFRAAIQYVVEEQGTPMALWESRAPR